MLVEIFAPRFRYRRNAVLYGKSAVNMYLRVCIRHFDLFNLFLYHIPSLRDGKQHFFRTQFSKNKHHIFYIPPGGIVYWFLVMEALFRTYFRIFASVSMGHIRKRLQNSSDRDVEFCPSCRNFVVHPKIGLFSFETCL